MGWRRSKFVFISYATEQRSLAEAITLARFSWPRLSAYGVVVVDWRARERGAVELTPRSPHTAGHS